MQFAFTNQIVHFMLVHNQKDFLFYADNVLKKRPPIALTFAKHLLVLLPITDIETGHRDTGHLLSIQNKISNENIALAEFDHHWLQMTENQILTRNAESSTYYFVIH